MTTPFPLLRLPRLALIPVFQQMEPLGIIAFSLLSKRAMRLSQFFRLKSEVVSLVLGANRIDMMVRLTCGLELGLDYQIGNGRVIWWIHQKKIVWPKLRRLSMVDCISRIIRVTHSNFIDDLSIFEVPRYDVFPILGLLPTIHKVSVSNIPDTLALGALKIVLLKTSKLDLCPTYQLRSMEKFQEILIANLDVINISRDLPFTLDDLLMTNAIKIKLKNPTLKAKDLNRFFKLWMQNRCNPRMEYLSVWTDNFFREDLLRNGLNAVQVSGGTTRTFRASKYVEQQPNCKTISGGFDIKRVDGTKGTIEIRKVFRDVQIRFYVWP
ncbi:hypothetical protein CRE_10423 [Caenorhabditis remanei]|uniref:F-box domain-containing protein n=1 Tax=Caenorhabditis remanei TaxID=31234 RepID=E3N0T4_CAERE|nr:hypothetical protein CRE_10423 [Caenorhabditis remanei]